MHSTTAPRRINVAAMLVAALATLGIFVSAPHLFPAVPPGPIILTVAAGIVALARGRWTLVIGVAVPLYIVIGGLISGGLVNSLNENAGAFTATAIQVVALLAAIATGGVAASARRRRPLAA